MCQCPLTGFIHFYPATWEAPVYKALKGVFSPRFFKLLQKCYILSFFCFSKILLLTCTLFYHIFIVNARTFLTPGQCGKLHQEIEPRIINDSSQLNKEQRHILLLFDALNMDGKKRSLKRIGGTVFNSSLFIKQK